jgi:hypothetical protein
VACGSRPLCPFHFKKRGIKKVIVAPEGVSQPVAVTETPVLTPEQDQPLLKALGRGIYWQQLIDSGVVASGTEIAEREGIHRSTVNVLLASGASLSRTLSRLPTKDGFPGPCRWSPSGGPRCPWTGMSNAG